MNALRTEKSLLLVAGCGTGKTYGTIKALENQKFIFLVPNRTVKKQLSIHYNLEDTGEKASLKTLLQRGAERIVCCYESLALYVKHGNSRDMLSDFVIVVDEVHSIIGDLHYRDNLELFDLTKCFKRTVFLTATPDLLFIEDNRLMGVDVKIINFDSVKKPNFEIKLLNSKENKITKGTYVGLKVLMDSWTIPTLFIVSSGISTLEKAGFTDIITSENTDTERYKSIVNGVLPDGLTVSTNLFNAGLSIYNKEEVNLVIDFKRYDFNYGSLAQLIQRFRESAKVNVYIVDRLRASNKASTREIKEEVNKQLDLLNSGKLSLKDSIIFNPFMQSLVVIKNGMFSIKWDNLPAVRQLINGYKNQTKAVLNQLKKVHGCKIVKEPIIIEDIATEKIVSSVKKRPKTILRELFVDDSGEDINDFATAYFMYRINPNNKSNSEWLERSYLQEWNELNIILNDDKSLRNTLSELVQKVSGGNLKRNLLKYFGITYEFDETDYTEEEKESLRVELLELGIDNQRYSGTRKILAEHIYGFIKSYEITGNNKITKIINWLGLKRSKKMNVISIVEKN